MCGVSGIFDVSTAGLIDRAALQRMNDAIAHRGPDGEGLHTEPGSASLIDALQLLIWQPASNNV